MILTTVKIEDFDRWWNTFSTKGAEKRKQHGSRGSYTFRDPNDESRTWTVFPDWDEEGFQELPVRSRRSGDLSGSGNPR